MTEFFAPHTPDYTINIPEDLVALIGWGVWFVVLLVWAIQLRKQKVIVGRAYLIWLAVLSVLILVFIPFFGLGNDIFPGDYAETNPVQHLMLFAAVPWMLAGGVLGYFPALLLAAMSGVLLSYLDTHNIFTPLIFMTLALGFTWCVRQRFRTTLFKLLRFPPIAALASLVVALPFVLSALILSTSGRLADRFFGAFSQLGIVALHLAIMMMIGGIISAMVGILLPKSWVKTPADLPAPGETSLRFRLLAVILPVLLLLLMVLSVSMLFVEKNIAKRTMMQDMKVATNAVSEGLPLFAETGKQLVLGLADEPLLLDPDFETAATLAAQAKDMTSFFSEILLVGLDGEIFISGQDAFSLTTLENDALTKVISGDTFQMVWQQNEAQEEITQFSFIAGVAGPSEGNAQRVLIGRTNVETNQILNVALSQADRMIQKGGAIQVTDKDGSRVYFAGETQAMPTAGEITFTTATYFETQSDVGGVLLHYNQPVEALAWGVWLSLPGDTLWIAAWDEVLPLIGFGLILIIIILLVIWAGFSPLTQELDALAGAAKAVSEGSAEIHLPETRTKGELSTLRNAFTQMLGAYQIRTQKDSALVSLSAEINQQRDLESILQDIMETALTRGISSVRIVLMKPTNENTRITADASWGMGKHSTEYAALDEAVLDRTYFEGPFVLSDFRAGKVFAFDKGKPFPAALISMPIQWENNWLGVLWTSYQDQRSPSQEDIDFFKSLAQMAASAVVKAKAEADAQAINQQLESILDILTDAVLVIDEQGRVVYHNRGANRIFGWGNRPVRGNGLSSLLSDEAQIELLTGNQLDTAAKEVRFSNGNIYQVAINPVQIYGQADVQAVIFTDITHQKVLDSQRTEFVTTVSHELRSPLTLVHGYAKILRLTGNLNEQQDAHISKIIDGIEEMKHLVQNLLDIGRLESRDALEFTRFNVVDFAREVIDGVMAQARQKNIELKLVLPETPMMISADATFLKQALKNLLENAIKFTKMGGDVALHVRAKQGSAVFAVQDNGIGIAPLDQRRIFDRFHRPGQGGDAQQGSGLGLAIVKSIAERHGGRVWLESQLGKGSTFYIEIPRSK
jgi:PAS domain S-box-containing protein